MSDVQLTVNGSEVKVQAGTVVAAAIAQVGMSTCRHSVTGEQRGPLCGMGICFECRVTINDKAHYLSCQTICEEGMRVVTT
jgi:aerobic-type carbon monoxide dehydrogenase small subunit (CoxS/CutS family)